MENLPVKESKSLKFFLILLGLVILVLIGEGVYWLKLKKEKKLFIGEMSEQVETKTFLSEEEQLHAGIISIYGGEQSVDTDIFKALENAKKFDPQKFPENMDQYTCYTIIASRLIGKYYASSGVPENRNPEILKVLAQIREMARQNSRFYEEDWKVDYVDSY